MRTPTRRIAAVSALTALALLLAACGSNEDAATPAGQSDALAQPADTPAPGATPLPSPGVTPGPAGTVGAACASLPQSGPGSLNEMATQPVATAVASNPELSTLTDALESAGLADQLDQAQDITLFAPINEAFDAVPDEVLDEILADPQGQLTELLSYHVVEERLTPDTIDGEHDTMLGDPITVVTSAGEIKVNDAATVLCGNIPTANGLVYLIDQVLMP